MLVGYGRTSTVEQSGSLERQVQRLSALGCERVFSEQISSVARRAALDEALAFVRQGDTLVVTRLDRLARSVADLVDITRTLDRKGVSLSILDLSLDTSTPTGQLMLNLLGSIAQFERQLMLDRQKEGIQRAKAAGRYKGRKPTAMAKAEEVRAMVGAGEKPSSVARALGISRASVYRILAA
jgi:DNA invertase Pin-like site-specific DNA recombinase